MRNATSHSQIDIAYLRVSGKPCKKNGNDAAETGQDKKKGKKENNKEKNNDLDEEENYNEFWNNENMSTVEKIVSDPKRKERLKTIMAQKITDGLISPH